MKKWLGKIGVGISICSLLFGGVSFGAATKHITQFDAGNDYVTIVDTITSGTNTTNEVVLGLHGVNKILVQLDPYSITIGTITFGIEQSLNDASQGYGSITACEMVRATNTLITTQTLSVAGATGTAFLNAGDYGGTHTSSFGGQFSIGTNTSQFYKINTLAANFLKFKQSHSLTGTDTAKYRITVRPAQN